MSNSPGKVSREQPRDVFPHDPRQHFCHLVLDVSPSGHAEDVVEFFEGDGFAGAGDEEPDEDDGEGVEAAVDIIFR